MQVLSKIEARIDSVSVNYEQEQFELWKKEQEKEFMEEVAFKRYMVNIVSMLFHTDVLYVRQALKEKENKLKQQFEEYDSIQQKKRLELYEANFNAELEDYKRRRETEVSSLYSRKCNSFFFVIPK
jgi:hypothetical protein